MTKKELERIARNGIYAIGINSRINHYLHELGYNHGTYGWNWTALNGFCGISFVYGYRAFPKNTVYCSPVLAELEKELEEIESLTDVTSETRTEYAMNTIWKYCAKLV